MESQDQSDERFAGGRTDNRIPSLINLPKSWLTLVSMKSHEEGREGGDVMADCSASLISRERINKSELLKQRL
jgi:hypothetical protein